MQASGGVVATPHLEEYHKTSMYLLDKEKISEISEPEDEGEACPPFRVLILFAGPGGRDDSLAAFFRLTGAHVDEVDTKIGGVEHDLTRTHVSDLWINRIVAGDYDAVFAAPPCSSYSISHDPPLRSALEPLGVTPLPSEWRAYVEKHNRLTTFTAAALRAAHDLGMLWAAENPADRGVPGSPAYWPAFAGRGSIWRVPCMADLASSTGAAVYTFAQCACGAPAQKYTTILAPPAMKAALTPFRRLVCTHKRGHAVIAMGYDVDGSSLSAPSAAYPPRMNELLADAFTRAHKALALTTRRDGGGGGRITDGPQLCAPVRAACEAARREPACFASLRSKVPLSPTLVAALAMPPGPQLPMRSRPPRPRRQSGRPLPPTSGAKRPVGDIATVATKPSGDIHISQLFSGDIYHSRVAPWLALSAAAIAALREGRRPPAVPTVVVTQIDMAPWARGIVWDTRDPDRCSPVRRSTRDTVFPGRRQVDRAAVREAARELDWHDEDIVSQIGEGGVEARSGCELTTVLAFHHQGLFDHVSAVDAIVQAELGEEWLEGPRAALPFVPARVLPRNVVMQARTRLDAAGRLEHYLKPRITTDASDGGLDSVNAGVPFHDRSVQLTTARDLGRAAAIADSSTRRADGSHADDVRAELYAIDWESAYRFLVMQVADLWTQVFLWFDASGRVGYFVDWRLAFGGRYAVNRFQRFGLLVAGLSCERIAAFDATQPPSAVQPEWTARRAALQAAGRLPPERDQLHPRFSKPYIDDTTGTALNDRVLVPEDLQLVALPSTPSESGGLVSHPSSRVAVHCRIHIVVAQRFGLAISVRKVQLGDPIVALGISASVLRFCLRCPESKRGPLLVQLRALHDDACVTPPRPVERAPLPKLVGRLLNLSQVAPELRPRLAVGYALAAAKARQHRRPLPYVQLAAGSHRHSEWLALLVVAITLLNSNEGVPLACSDAFPSRDAPGTLTVTSDASGDDGIGGWATSPDVSGTIWMLSEPWPVDLRSALARGAGPAALRGPLPALSMPAAETFAACALVSAVRRLTRVRAVVAVVDCQPAARVLCGAITPNAQMRRVAELTLESASPWLGVHVVRELNLDADRLSHPDQADAVTAEATAAGFTICRVAVPAECWRALRLAAELGCGLEAA